MSAPLRPYQPASDCVKCGSEDVVVDYHRGATAGAFCWPAIAYESRVITEHLCKRCVRCGYGWCEQTADAYPETDPEEDPVSIRKTATAEGVIGVEDAPGIQKTAAADAPWVAEDEAALERENDSADQG